MVQKMTINCIAILMISLFLGACSEKSLVTKMPDDLNSKDASSIYGFTFFELTIDTKDKKQAIVAKFDTKHDATTAKYENMTDGEYLYGNKAMNKLNTIFNEFSLDPDMPAEDMIKEVSSAFEIVDYKNLQLGIQFTGHDKKDLMMSK